MNDGIPKNSYLDSAVDLSFPRVDDLVELIKIHGQGCHLYKRDLKRAYRQIPVDPGDVPLLGYCFEEYFYFDKFLSMGLRSAAHICQRVTNAIRYMCLMMKIAVLNYLDDFAGADSPMAAQRSFTELGRLLESCGIEESKQKACPPSTRMTFIGVLFDSEALTLSVTPERLQEILSLLDVWLLKSKATLHDLQSLIGKPVPQISASHMRNSAQHMRNSAGACGIFAESMRNSAMLCGTPQRFHNLRNLFHIPHRNIFRIYMENLRKIQT